MNSTNRPTRRNVIAAGASATLAIGGAVARAQNAPAAVPVPPPAGARKIKLGLVGCGGRGTWVTKLFLQHGGYELVGVADYFQDNADKAGEAFGVDKSRRFTGLAGHKKLLDSGVEAIAIESIPHFFAEQAMAAAEAGVHVYLAKPVAVDVPGCHAIAAAGKLASDKKRVFLVDYQMRTDPINREVIQRIHDGGLGRIVHLSSIGFTGGRGDPAKGPTMENLLQRGHWTSTTALGGDTIVEYSIHIIDAILWVMKDQRPVAASGSAIRCRPNPQGDRHDAMCITYDFEDGTLWSHRDQTLSNTEDLILRGTAHGTIANAQITYWGRSYLRGGPKHYGGGDVASLYDAGAKWNVARFHEDILKGNCENPSPQRAADGALTAILGREAAARKTRISMADLIKENKKLDIDRTGLKA